MAEVKPSGLVLTDTYPSAPLGMSRCQAGEERYLRVIDLSAARPVLTLSRKVESCHDNLELADPGIDWNAASRSLQIHWLSGPDGSGTPSDVSIGLDQHMKPLGTVAP